VGRVLDWEMQSRPGSVTSEMADALTSCAKVVLTRCPTESASEMDFVSTAGSEAEGSVAGRLLTRRKRGPKGRMWAAGDSDSDGAEPEPTQKSVSPNMSAPTVPRKGHGKGRGGYSHSVGLSQARRELEDGAADSGSSTLTETDVEPTLMPAPTSAPRKKKGNVSPVQQIPQVPDRGLRDGAPKGDDRLPGQCISGQNGRGVG
jgi:hypothetical protein